MAISKEDILAVGIEVFSEKGYQDASVLDIAGRCGISKASFYSFFPSKEDIFIAVFMELQDTFKSNIAMLANTRLEPRVRLQYASALLIDLMSKKSPILRSSSTPEPPIISSRKREFGGWILQVFKGLIEAAYGSEMEPYIWDMTLLQRGLNREFANLLANGNLGGRSANQASEYACNILDYIAKGLMDSGRGPFITPSIAESYIDFSLGENADLSKYMEHFEENVRNALGNVRHAQRAEEIFQMVQFFKSEIQNEKPRWYLLHAILDSFRKEKELRSVTKQLQRLLAATLPEADGD